jgi:hypothetical protein
MEKCEVSAYFRAYLAVPWGRVGKNSRGHSHSFGFGHTFALAANL